MVYSVFEVISMFYHDCYIEPAKVFKQHWTITNYYYTTTPRPDNGFMLVINGNIDFITESQTLRAKKGDIIFLPAQCYYEVIFHTELGAVDNYLVNFISDKPFCDTSTPLRILENAPSYCFKAFRQYVEEDYSTANSVYRNKGLLYFLLDTVIESTAGIRSRHAYLLEEAKNFMQKNTDCSIDEVAKRYAMSPSSFRQLFKTKFGMSPIQYRTQVKIEKAIHLLESTDMSTSEISNQLGFYDVAYFCKCFQTHTGMTPKQYSQSKSV